MNKQNLVRRICKNGVLVALMCIVGMFSIPLGANVKVSLQLLMVFLICLISESVIDCLLITTIYLLLGLLIPCYAGFSAGISPTFGFVLSFVVISPIIYFLNKILKIHPAIKMFIACFIGLLVSYFIGTIFMMIYMDWKFIPTLLVSVVPYIPFDIIKIIIVISIILLLPNRYNSNSK